MKWFSLLAILVTLFNLTFPSAVFAESGKPVVIKSISYGNDSESQETITFKLAAPVVPKIFFLPGEKPRLVIDFPQSIYLGKNTIALPDGNLVSAVRIGLHQTPIKKTRAVLDLSTKMPAQYATEYVEQEHTLIVTLTPDSTQKQANAPLNLQPESPKTLPIQEKITIKPRLKKTLYPVFSAKKVAEEVAVEKVEPPVVPMIFEISFDDSSNKGEMVLFRLNDFYPPIVSAIEKDTPRVLCDFLAMNLDPKVQKAILANGRYVKRIDTAMHQDPQKVRVVLELSPERDYDLQQVFFRNDNLFILMVNELNPDQSAQ